MPLTPNVSLAKGLLCIPHALALTLSTFRYHHRWRIGRLWWDDHWAMISSTFDTLLWLAFLLEAPKELEGISTRTRVVLQWLSVLCFPLTIWCARISVGVAAVRVLPPGSIVRTLGVVLNFLLASICIGHVVSRIYICSQSSNIIEGRCVLPQGVGIYHMIADIVADSLLFAITLRTIWRVKLLLGLRRIVFVAAVANIFTAFGGVAYGVLLWRAKRWGDVYGILVLLTSQAEATIALVVCNLLVTLTYIYRGYRNRDNVDHPDTSYVVTSIELLSQHVSRVQRHGTTEHGHTLTTSFAFTDWDGESGSVAPSVPVSFKQVPRCMNR